MNMVDVAHRFHKCFGWALTISACQVAVGLCCRLWEGDLVSPVLFTLYQCLMGLFVALWLLLFYIRLQASGVACCGLLKEYFADASLKIQGLFIFVPLLVTGVHLGWKLLNCCRSNKRSL